MFNKKWKLNEYITYALLTFVSLASWTDINGIFTELPQIILTQPESWSLGASIGLITNIGNIAPFALILYKCARRKRSLNLIPLNYGLILVGMTSCLLLIFFWSKTVFILNENRSLALYLLAFIMSLLDCTSMVTLSDYMARYKVKFTSALFLGESLTTIIPSLLAIAQGNGEIECVTEADDNNSLNSSTYPIYKTARFSVSIYFLCIFFTLAVSFSSYVILQWTKISNGTMQNEAEQTFQLENSDGESMNTKNDVKIVKEVEEDRISTHIFLLLIFGSVYTSSVIFGVLLSMSAFVLMPYGHHIFYLGTILSPWMLSIVWLLGTIKPLVAKRYLLMMILLGSITFSVDLFVSFRSPCPPYVNTTKGNIFVLVIWLSTYILLGYPRLVIANYARAHSNSGMFWFGVSVQTGALIGSVVAYLLVDTFGLFHEQLPCEAVLCY